MGLGVVRSPDATGRAVFETHCAPCHGITGRGEYPGHVGHVPAIAGAREAKVTHMVRDGGKHMPAFSTVDISDAALGDLAAFVHQLPDAPAGEPARIGPRTLDPLAVGLVVCGALAVLASLLALLFGGGRN